MGTGDAVTAHTERELLEAVHAADEAGLRLFLTSGGRVPPPPRGPWVRVAIKGVDVDETGCDTDDLVYCGAVQVKVSPGEQWDGLVERAVEAGWVGVEALSWIPGSVTDAVRDNCSAHGQAVADVVVSVRSWDRIERAQRTFPAVDCGFGPRSSRFQEALADGTDRYVILEVSLLLRQGELTRPITDAELAALLGVTAGGRVPLLRVRQALRPPSNASRS